MNQLKQSPPRNLQPSMLKEELEEMRNAELMAQQTAAAREDAVVVISDLTPTEQQAANLNVHPEAWRPISWMNDSHYASLLRTNALDGRLAQQLEAFKSVSLGQS